MEFANTGDYFEQEAPIDKIIRFLYGLSQAEHDIFKILFTLKSPNSKKIGEKVNRKTKGIINQYLKKLVELNLITRRKKGVEGKAGFHYIYDSHDIEQLKEQILSRINKWHQLVISRVEKLESFYTKELTQADSNETKREYFF